VKTIYRPIWCHAVSSVDKRDRKRLYNGLIVQCKHLMRDRLGPITKTTTTTTTTIIIVIIIIIIIQSSTRTNTALLIDIPVPVDARVDEKEQEKTDKYQDLAMELYGDCEK